MKQCFSYRWRVFRYAWWLPLLLLALAILMGMEATGTLHSYLRRVGEQEARSSLAFVMDVRHFFPLAGAVWSAAYFGMEIDGRGASLLLSRGFGRFQVFGSSYLFFLGGMIAVSVMEQAFVLLTGVPAWTEFPPAFLLRTFLLRLILDLGMMALPGFLPFLGNGSLYARFLGFAYGLALWRLMGSHYQLWLPELGILLGWRELWPIPALMLGILGYVIVHRKKEA